MSLIRTICISVILFLSSLTVAFASSGDVDTNNKVKEKNQETSILQNTINNYILEVYKSQGNKIIQDLDANLEKMNVNSTGKMEVYSNIQETFKLKKKSIESDKEIGKNAKLILLDYINHMINELENKKKNLQ